MEEGSYLTLGGQGEIEYVERRSRFLAHARPVTTEEEALAFLEQIRSKYWDASHNVYAYSLREGQIRRFSDDGEPQGTSGMPTLEVLTKSGITDAIIVVTRYFGGVLLGAGGLVRAYSHEARMAVDAAEVLTMRPCTVGELRCDYTQYGKLAALLPAMEGVVEDTIFEADVCLKFHIPTELCVRLDKQLADATCGQVAAEYGEEKFFPAK